MSEYQYYEFQAIDRPLTPAEMAELRKRSTRASISPTRFQNVYHWGDLKGDPREWVERYFDAFVYVANWGTTRLILRLPRPLLDPKTVYPYEAEEALSIETKGDAVLLEFRSDDEDGGWGWIEDEEAEGWMPALLPLRAELADGDLRALYLGWLGAAAGGLLDEDEPEPPVPPGLGRPSAAQAALAKFLRVSDDLLAVAAAASPKLAPAPPADDLQPWIATLPLVEKDALLARLVDNPTLARAELVRRFRAETAPPAASAASTRTVGELLAAAEERTAEQERKAAERKAAERVRYLESLADRQESLWREIDALIERKQAKEYDQATALLKDLHDLSVHQGKPADFALRLRPLRERHARKPAFIERLNKAGL